MQAQQTAVAIEDQKLLVFETTTTAEKEHQQKLNMLMQTEAKLKGEAAKQMKSADQLLLKQKQLNEDRNRLHAVRGNVQASEQEASFLVVETTTKASS